MGRPTQEVEMFKKVLVANRGEIACRIIRTLKRMGIASVAVYSEADKHARHVLDADESIDIGESSAASSYLNIDIILEAAQKTGAEAIHPGYGFLSENAQFAELCEAKNIVFIGPTAKQMRDFGLKHTARQLAKENGLPLLPGSGLLADWTQAAKEAENIGYPVMLKSTAGGGGIGMQLIPDAQALPPAFESIQRLSKNNFKNSGIYCEKFVEAARHIEVQIFGDGKGYVVALGERDCSMQRRNQKVIEETPAPNISQATREKLCDSAVKLASAIHYRSAGTVEFVYDDATNEFYFLEVNTRLQVEHGVTELVTGLDLVEWMIRIAAKDSAFLKEYIHQSQGHAIQVRVYAEDANKNFQPSSGILTEATFSNTARIDSWVSRGTEISPFYDPLIAKILVHQPSRKNAITAMQKALDETKLSGIETNLNYCQQVLAAPAFSLAKHNTRYLNTFLYRPNTIDVLDGGMLTTIQDYPGRLGYWHVGVPPSGPMDSLSHRLANQLVGNTESLSTLEMTLIGCKLKFNADAVVAITGAPLVATLDHVAINMWQSYNIKAGSILNLGSMKKTGCRAYLAVSGGFDVPTYLGSQSTFTLGQFGGHGGRALRIGDVLHLNKNASANYLPRNLPQALIPAYSHHWQLSVLYGPHGAPDFFTESDIAVFFNTDYEVHYNSNTTGIRLIGPKPQWARAHGGEAGLHPSNIHDNAYAIGSIDFTGDMPIILGPDGPSLGGFVCPAVIAQVDLWKIGQVKAGDKIRFVRISQSEANTQEIAQNQAIESLKVPEALTAKQSLMATSVILHETVADVDQFKVVYRQAGDKNLLIEYGDLVLDLNLRFRVHALMQWLEDSKILGIIDLTPGIRSLQVHFDSLKLPLEKLIEILKTAEKALPAIAEMEVPTRIVHLPLSWEDPSIQTAVSKYMQSVRKDAPWCAAKPLPNNTEFIKRINGLESEEAVKDIIFNASYLTLGLGDVYLGAPVATPIDPRHRLVTTKYNPARTWTPENAVGIGGAYMCIYGMESPGGYQLVGRTLPVWNRWNTTDDFKDGAPWLLRFFDQIRYYPVTAAELVQLRADFLQGKFKLTIEETTFKLKDYNQFLLDNAASIDAFKETQQAAFDAERERWITSGQADYIDNNTTEAIFENHAIPDGYLALSSHVAGNCWQIKVAIGDFVTENQVLLIIESMKMEIAIYATQGGKITQILCKEGSAVNVGQQLLMIEAL